MSGISVAYGNSNRSEIDDMMHRINHRGPYASGVYTNDRIIMAQNYLQADITIADNSNIPFRSSKNPGLAICYDGQIGNWSEIALRYGVEDGAYKEERLLLALYKKHGRGMLQYLNDAVFAFVIFDGQGLFAARDLLGIKTMFYGQKDNTIYLASELKALLAATSEVYEFPNGHYMDQSGDFTQFAKLPQSAPRTWDHDVEQMAVEIRDIIERSFRNRIDFSVSTGGLLSGGMDSSVINYLASKAYKEKYGKEAKLNTFALGVGESSDVLSARVVTDHIDSEHHELIVGIEQMLDALPEVIYYLESFDPSLVRSAVSNEIFCGYKYLEHCPTDELFARQMECLGFLHNNASLRLDRMNMCNSIRVVAPLISGELLQYAMAIPPQYKQRPDGSGKIEKWIFRKAYETLLPESIVWRGKQEFSQGSGSANILPAHFEKQFSDSELAEAQAKYPIIRSKEELYYFQVFTEHFGTKHAVETVGQWISL